MSTERRKLLLKKLKKSKKANKGADLADEFSVSRQVIVNDIALLRAKGEKIIATARGYIMPEESGLKKRVIACKHQPTDVREELEIIINNGGRIKDVIVDHSIYGEIRGSLMIESKADIGEFLEKYEASESKLLSSLTNGTHLHTIEALNNSVLNMIEKKLKKNNFLLQE